MAIAKLTIDLEASFAKFSADMRGAVSVAEQAARRIDKAFIGVGGVFAGSVLAGAATAAARGLVTLVPQLVTSVAHLQDLEEITGASAVGLASMQTAADVAGLGVDQLAGFMVKLTGTLSRTNEETKGAGAALKALGLDLGTFKQLAPEQQFEALGKALNSFKDGPQKTAIAIALMGKSGAEALPFLKALGEEGQSQIRLSAEQIRMADELADRNAKLGSEMRQLAQAAAVQALPALNALFEAMNETARAVLGLTGDVKTLAASGGTAFEQFAQFAVRAFGLVVSAGQGVSRVFEVIGTAAGAGAAQMAAVVDGEFKRALSIAKEARDDIDKILQRPLFTEALDASLAKQKAAQEAARGFVGPVAGDTRPALRFAGAPDKGAANAAAAADRLRKAQLDAALKGLEAIFKEERDLVAFQQRFLDAEFSGGLVQLDDYYRRRQDLRRADLDAQVAAFAAEAQAVKASLADAKDPGERVRLQAQLQELRDKETAAVRASAQEQRLYALEEQRARQQALDQTVEFNAKVLELNGNLADAARLRADVAIGQARRSTAAIGLPTSSVDGFERATRAATELELVQQRIAAQAQVAGTAEERFLLAAERGALTTTEREQGLFNVRAANVAQLQLLREQVRALADAAGPDSPAAKFFQQLSFDIERATASMDPASQRMRAFTDDVAGALGQASIDFLGNVRDIDGALKGLEDSLLRIINSEVQRALTDQIRKGLTEATSGTGAFAQFFQSIFGVQQQGGTSAAGGAAGGAVASVAGGVAGTAADTAASTAAATAATSLATASTAAATAATSLATASTAAATAATSFATASAAGATSMASITTAAVPLDAALVSAATALTALAAAATSAATAQAGSAVAGAAFSSGGFTGSASSDAKVAGVVHANEYVFSAAAVRSLGVGRLEAMHREARGGASRYLGPGYRNGGYVGMASSPPSAAAPSRGAMAPTMVVHQNFIVQGGPPNRATQHQIASRAAMGLQEAAARR